MTSKVFQKILSSILVVTFSLCSAPVLFAEDISRETETIRRETFGEKRVAKTATKSEEKAAAEKYKTGVTYEDVLKDPDNIELNYRYAQNQITKLCPLPRRLDGPLRSANRRLPRDRGQLIQG